MLVKTQGWAEGCRWWYSPSLGACFPIPQVTWGLSDYLSGRVLQERACPAAFPGSLALLPCRVLFWPLDLNTLLSAPNGSFHMYSCACTHTHTHMHKHTHTSLSLSLKLVSWQWWLPGHHRTPCCVGIHGIGAGYLSNMYIAFLAFIVQSVLWILCFEFCNFAAF